MKIKNLRKPTQIFKLLSVCVVAVCCLAKTHAISLTVSFTDLPDVLSGQDLWEGDVNITSGSFAKNQGFTVYLPVDAQPIPGSASTLNGGWDLFLGQPTLKTTPKEPGFFDAFSLGASPGTTEPFIFQFAFSGSGVPSGPLTFETYNFDPLKADPPITTGAGFLSVPEALRTGWALAFALLCLTAYSARTVRKTSARL